MRFFGDCMHMFDYSYLKDSLLPAQLVNQTSNIAALKVLSAERRRQYARIFGWWRSKVCAASFIGVRRQRLIHE